MALEAVAIVFFVTFVTACPAPFALLELLIDLKSGRALLDASWSVKEGEALLLRTLSADLGTR